MCMFEGVEVWAPEDRNEQQAQGGEREGDMD